MADNKTKMLDSVATYYSERLSEYGESARGVDWNGAESQHIRFDQVCKIVDASSHFSIIDLGCGYGAMYEYLATRYEAFEYTGLDISSAMIDAARTRHVGAESVRFEVGSEPDGAADFVVASGIFNVRLDHDPSEWKHYIESTLGVMDRCSRRGFSFNCLTSYSDKDKMRDHLYYADPADLFDLCKQRYSRQVALLHDYGLYEFTILVRKSV